MERYKGYKVPISNVKIGNLLEKLNAMEGASLADVLEDAATKKELAAASGVDSIATETTSAADLLAALDQAIGLDADPEDVPESDEDSTKEPVKQRRRRNSKNVLLEEMAGPRSENGTVEENKVQDNFIDLTKLIPPLPKKGTFEVSTIKKSLYFFS